MLVGVAEDSVKAGTLDESKAKMDLLRQAGFDAVRLTAQWDPKITTPLPLEIEQLRNAAEAAQLDGVRVFLSVYPFGSSVTPLTPEDEDAFAVYTATLAQQLPQIRDFIIGNEPNLNRFWMPQFGPSGEDVAASAYGALLARTYDRLKAVDPQLNVIGGAVSPRGGDRPNTGRDTHSPTAFIADLGKYYRSTGRTLPIMDMFAFHPYPENSSVSPALAHPNGTSIGLADYAKLVSLLGRAFDGTAQKGSTLPILYAEFGVETQIPPAEASLYHGREPATIKSTTEAVQAADYSQAIGMSFCEPNVVGLLLFHAFDESDLDRFQSGVYYANLTPKSSLAPVRSAIRALHGGTIATCPGLRLTPRATVVSPPPRSIAAGKARLSLTCNLDCVFSVRLVKEPKESTTLATRGSARAGRATPVALPPRRVARGRYRLIVTVTAPTNPARPSTIRGPVIAVS